MNQKPTLYNGFVIKENIFIKYRLKLIFNVEIYKLSNDKFFYLFLDVTGNLINSNFDLINIRIGNKLYLGFIHDNYDLEYLRKIKSVLTEKRGFAMIAGMEDIKNILKEEIIVPFKNKEKYKKYKLKLPNGVLFYGPPGCGKTYISNKLAEELGWTFMEVRHSDIACPYIHGGVEKIRQVFDDAKLKAPIILFFDEISGLVPKRELIDVNSSYKEEEINEFLVHLDNCSENDILVIGATNFPDRIDTAILRTGRLDLKIFIGPPNFDTRKQVFQHYLEGIPIENINYNILAEKTENFIISDISYIIEKAAKKAVIKNISINMDLLLTVINDFTPSITKEQLEFYSGLFSSIKEERRPIGFQVTDNI